MDLQAESALTTILVGVFKDCLPSLNFGDQNIHPDLLAKSSKNNEFLEGGQSISKLEVLGKRSEV